MVAEAVFSQTDADELVDEVRRPFDDISSAFRTPSLFPGQKADAAGAGVMFALRHNMLSGSYRALMVRSLS